MSKILNALTFLLIAMNAGAALAHDADSSSILTSHVDPRFDSRFIIKAGERARTFVYSRIEEQSAAEQAGQGTRLEVLDARDPRLYGAGQPIQPPVPADLALVRINQAGQFRVIALMIDRPGAFAIKLLNGSFVLGISTSVERLEISSYDAGNYASISRSTAGAGWLYNRYVRNFGNQVTPDQFDALVADFLTEYVRRVASN